MAVLVITYCDLLIRNDLIQNSIVFHKFHNDEAVGKGEHEVPCQRPYKSLQEDITLTLFIKTLGKIINSGNQL